MLRYAAKGEKMLQYLIETTDRLAPMVLCLGFIFAYEKGIRKNKKEYFMPGAALLGIVLAVLMAYFKTYTSKVDTSLWNLRNYAISLIAVLIFFAGSVLILKKKKIGKVITQTALSVLTVFIIVYYLPTILEMPHTMLLTEESILSTNFLIRLTGMFLGIILALVLGLSVYRGGRVFDAEKVPVYLYIVLLLNSLRYIGLGLGIMLTKRIIGTNHTFFVISKYTSNYGRWFLYGMILVCVVLQIRIIIKSCTNREPYEHSAQRRKIIAKWRRRRRWSVTMLLCSVITVVILTAVAAYAGREVELSPIEKTKQDEENMYISFDQVSDGLLHRYGYTAEDGTVIRFIIIKKPNSSSYGIGLDACEICGETGYYERNGSVICNLCDVVMNINTIGFKGGCNPIVIDYSIKDGNIVVPIDDLLEHKDEFK